MKSSDRNKYFSFLRRLRAGGRNNMYGAVPYLMSAFGLDREAAFRVICEWLDLQTAEVSPPPAAQSAPAPAPVHTHARGARSAKLRRGRKGRLSRKAA